MASRAFAFVIWAAVAGSLVFWLLRLSSGSRPVPAHTIAVGENALAGGDLSRLFGREAAPAAPGAAPAAGSPFKLVGVVAPREGSGLRAGVALISIEGKPARPFRVGAAIESDVVLLAVHQRGASLGPRGGTPTLRLELPALPPPNTGTLGAPPSAAQEAPAGPLPTRRPGQRLPPPVEVEPRGDAPPDVEATDPGQRVPEPGQRSPEATDRPSQ